jgi:GNAT superfamily N-acetyltransferase
MTDFTSPRVVIRPALPCDIADVAEFTKLIWDGHDYVGDVFPHWLEDPHGQLLAAEYAGHCVGTAKVTLLAPGQWWLEGFRVDPNYQDRKIGSRLDAYANEWWDEHGDGTLRLLTSSKRVQVHHLSELRGFVRLGDVLAYEASALDEKTDAFVPLAPDDVNEAVAFCQRIAPGRMMNFDWRFGTPNADSLRAVADEGRVWWWRGRRGFLLAWENDEDDATNLTVGFEACADEERAELLTDFRRLASARGMVTTGWMNMMDDEMPGILERAGYQRDWDDAAYLYERSHPTQGPRAAW